MKEPCVLGLISINDHTRKTTVPGVSSFTAHIRVGGEGIIAFAFKKIKNHEYHNPIMHPV